MDFVDLPVFEQGGSLQLHEHPDLLHLEVGLAWDAQQGLPDPLDLDLCAFLLNEDGKVRRDQDFVFYNNRLSPCGTIEHSGDEKTGTRVGDDEALTIDLSLIPDDVNKIVFCASLHKAEKRQQNFGMVKSGMIRLIDKDKGQEIAQYNLSSKNKAATAVIFGEIYRHDIPAEELPPSDVVVKKAHLQNWQFCLIGQGDEGGLKALAQDFGVNV